MEGSGSASCSSGDGVAASSSACAVRGASVGADSRRGLLRQCDAGASEHQLGHQLRIGQRVFAPVQHAHAGLAQYAIHARVAFDAALRVPALRRPHVDDGDDLKVLSQTSKSALSRPHAAHPFAVRVARRDAQEPRQRHLGQHRVAGRQIAHEQLVGTLLGGRQYARHLGGQAASVSSASSGREPSAAPEPARRRSHHQPIARMRTATSARTGVVMGGPSVCEGSANADDERPAASSAGFPSPVVYVSAASAHAGRHHAFIRRTSRSARRSAARSRLRNLPRAGLRADGRQRGAPRMLAFRCTVCSVGGVCSIERPPRCGIDCSGGRILSVLGLRVAGPATK